MYVNTDGSAGCKPAPFTERGLQTRTTTRLFAPAASGELLTLNAQLLTVLDKASALRYYAPPEIHIHVRGLC